ncbi:MarR family winged helix-turn-helix transcriptional regulator [Subtercola endophyticus]|uniref:MarR family winged helix-turn-helix transcriptional regulator n=1 Tax=Subtercola endophyticus TaxID=2895559 RepID=UPI001E5C8CAD|nr:MarR family transcriptional regulator [Subtercola endophyticus]UFS57540.1 MarR family transcriptional regulator [Subtercola endophyticus]
MPDDDAPLPPTRLRDLAQWQVSKVSTLGARLTATRMPLHGRADFAILAALDEYGALSQAELGRRLGLDRNDVNGVINRLASAHQVVRKTDPTDRRRNIITLTAAGAVYLAELEAHADDVQHELLHALDDDEQRQLRDLLAKLLAGHTPQPA